MEAIAAAMESEITTVIQTEALPEIWSRREIDKFGKRTVGSKPLPLDESADLPSCVRAEEALALH